MEPLLAVRANIRIFACYILSIVSIQRKAVIVSTYVVCCLVAIPSQATTVVVIIDINRILIGADSLWKGSKSGTALRCKIERPKQECIFAIVGLRNRSETGFDSASFAGHACELTGSLTAIATAFGDSVREPLRRAMAYSRLNDPIVYKRDYRGKSPLEVVFAGFQEGKPSAAIKSFALSRTDKLTDGPPIQIPDSAGNDIAFGGEQEAAKLYLCSATIRTPG